MNTKKINTNTIILISSLYFTFFCNIAFFKNVLNVYPLNEGNLLFVLSLAIFLTATTVILLGLICTRNTARYIFLILFPCAALAGYFMDSYNIVIDTAMIQNLVLTDTGEFSDLLSGMLLFRLFAFGVLPAILVWHIKLPHINFIRAIWMRLLLISGAMATITVVVLINGAHYADFFRDNKILRYYTNPITFIYSTGKYLSEQLATRDIGDRLPVGEDARIPDNDYDRELIIMVVGETARADHFSLNGYYRKTNPKLEKYNLISLKNMNSCATSTALSLPCIFSYQKTSIFDINKFSQEENLLDILEHAGVNVLWRDNNSDSKGVANSRIYEDFKNPVINPICDIECRDEGMLAGLDDFIKIQTKGDIFIVLHQMGNHGPAYFKRYPKRFEVFIPTCQSIQLEKCSNEEIINAYDNAILYTDYFLTEVIDFLSKYDEDFETAMFYVSDHGESLGEHNLYLHGLPNFIAPKEQRHVSSILWFGKNYEVDYMTVSKNAEQPLSHDNVFHTVLGLMEIQTKLYKADEDIL